MIQTTGIEKEAGWTEFKVKNREWDFEIHLKSKKSMEFRFRLPKTCSYHRRSFSFQPHVAFHTSTAGFAVLNVITGADFPVADLEDLDRAFHGKP